MKRVYVYLFWGCAVCGLWSGCVSTYRSIDPTYLSIDDYWSADSVALVEIAMDYDVLKGPRNKSYAKMEKKNKVSLVVFTIHNAGQHEFRLPQDLLIKAGSGDTILPLSIESAMEALVDPVTNEENTSAVEFEMGKTWNLLWGAGKATNDVKMVVSHVRFANDMLAYYFVDRALSPGSYSKGFLVLPMQKHSPVEISIRIP